MPGLKVVEEVVNGQEEVDLMQFVEGQEGQTEVSSLKRRVMHFGWVLKVKVVCHQGMVDGCDSGSPWWRLPCWLTWVWCGLPLSLSL